ncbi:MAG: recombinase family protein [Thermodesulfobacteriota bacterium]|nr:recombinase family protein [Thermodesulfobacteriota bacterium]
MNMSASINQKVTASHLKRQAYCYVRQSTLKQVFENTESTKRQYALRERAMALGWPVVQIVTIDSDLGETATSVADRQGFQKLMTEVSLGRVGLVMGLEVSRLARNNADWARLLEISAITNTLILDEDGIYDPTNFNDRLLLNMKGTFSEVELHVIKSRLRGGALNKARRGEFKTRLPTGFVYNHNDNVILDPDKQVQQTFRLFFDIFKRAGSAFSTVKAFGKDDMKFPSRSYSGHNKGDLEWQRLTYSRALMILKNPRYAGAYYYGRHRSRKNVDGSTTVFQVPQDEWLVLIKDAHPAYITWDQYEENIRRIRDNAVAYNNIDRKTPPREGPCLLQGLAVCGRCGQRMTIRYKYRRKGRIDPAYLCQRNRIERYEDSCQYIPGAGVDEAISRLIIESITPLTLEVALEVQRELEIRFNEADKLRKQQVERVEYEANLARRRFMHVDPDNRLVADTLEGEWNEKLRNLQEAKDYYEKHRQLDSVKLKKEQQKEIFNLARDFPKLWKNPKTPAREKKRMIRFLIEDVTMIKGEEITLHVRFKGGAKKTLKIPLPAKGWQHALTDPEIVELVDDLLNDHDYSEIATILNGRGYKSGTGVQFNRRVVTGIRRSYDLKTRYARLRNTGKLTAEEVAKLLGVSIGTVRRWGKDEKIKMYPYNDRNGCLYEHPGVNSSLMKKTA